MEFTPIKPIEPLWDTLPARGAQETKDIPSSIPFAQVFQSAIDNVRQTNQEQVNLEYQLSTGQLDNPALLTTATSKATTAALLLMEMRNKAVDIYNELMRISL